MEAVMKKKGMSNERLASLVGMPSSRVAGYRSGGRSLGEASAKRIASHLQVDPADLVVENRIAAINRAIDRRDGTAAIKATKRLLTTVESYRVEDDIENLDEIVEAVMKIRLFPRFGSSYSRFHSRNSG